MRVRARASAACSAVDVDARGITERSEIPDQRITLSEMLAHIEAGRVVFLSRYDINIVEFGNACSWTS